MRKKVIIMFIAIIFMTSTAFTKQRNYEVHFLDTGQSDCILIKAEDKNYLIDTGAAYYKDKIIKYLNEVGVNEIETLILTHYHDDHYGGLEEIVNRKKVSNVFLPIHNSKFRYEFFKMLREKGINVKYIDNNEKIKYKRMRLNALVPFSEDKIIENNNSVMLQGEVDGVKYLFAADCEKKEEEYMLKNKRLKSCDVMKTPHHGLDTSCTEEFLDKVSAKIAIVTANGIDTPDTKIMNRICKKDTKVFRTDQIGNIVIKNNILTALKGGISIKIN